MTTPEKSFDCVEMMRRIRDAITSETADLDDEAFDLWIEEAPLGNSEMERLREALEREAENLGISRTTPPRISEP